MSIEKSGYYKRVALIADKRTVTFFRLAGLKDVYPVESYEEAEKFIRKVLDDTNFLIILVTERIVNKIQDMIEGIAENKYPLIVPIPSVDDRITVKTDLINKLIKRKAGIELKLDGFLEN